MWRFDGLGLDPLEQSPSGQAVTATVEPEWDFSGLIEGAKKPKKPEEPPRIEAPPVAVTEPSPAPPTAAELLARGPRYVGGAFLETGRNWLTVDVEAIRLFAATASNLDAVAAFLGRPPRTVVFKTRDLRLEIPDAWILAVADKPQKRLSIAPASTDDHAPTEPAAGTMSARVLGLWREGKRAVEIAAEIGKPRNYVDGTIGTLRKRGLIEPSVKIAVTPSPPQEPDVFLPADEPVWVSLKDVATYLRGRDCEVKKFGHDDWKVDGAMLTDAGLLAKANRLREGQGQPLFTLTPP